MSTARPRNVTQSVGFLINTARYFEKRQTEGEDKAHWSNVYNAQNCRDIAEQLLEMEATIHSYRYGPLHDDPVWVFGLGTGLMIGLVIGFLI